MGKKPRGIFYIRNKGNKIILKFTFREFCNMGRGFYDL